MQADSGSDSDSDSRRQSAQWNVLCLTVKVHIVVVGSGGPKQVDGVRWLTVMISSFRFQIQSDIGTQWPYHLLCIDFLKTYIFILITMDTDNLISKVFLRPAIWNQSINQ